MSSSVSVLSSGHLFQHPSVDLAVVDWRLLLLVSGENTFLAKAWCFGWDEEDCGFTQNTKKLCGSQRTRAPRRGAYAQVAAAPLSCHHSSCVSSFCLASSPGLVEGMGSHSTMCSDCCSSFKHNSGRVSERRKRSSTFPDRFESDEQWLEKEKVTGERHLIERCKQGPVINSLQ